MAFHDLTAHGQTQSRSVAAGRPGGEERVEDAAPRLLVHSDATVGYRYAHAVADLLCSEAQLASSGHCIESVVEEVQQDLLDRVRIQLQARDVGVGLFDLDVEVTGPEANQFHRRSGQVVDARRDALWRPGSRELEQRLDDGPSPHGLVPDDGHLVVARIVGRYLGEKQLCKSEDAGERVVDLVGHRRGEFSHCAHLRRLKQLLTDALVGR